MNKLFLIVLFGFLLFGCVSTNQEDASPTPTPVSTVENSATPTPVVDYFEGTFDPNAPGEYKNFFDELLASGKNFDCNYTPASKLVGNRLLKRKGNFLKTVSDSSAGEMIHIAEMDSKKTFFKLYESKAEETGCDWVVNNDTSETPGGEGFAINYAWFMVSFESEYENGFIVCSKPNFAENEFSVTGEICPVEPVYS
ncbi:MAG: hypothetical protein ABH803_04020 [Candidatus Micrarchaeota archaeon]